MDSGSLWKGIGLDGLVQWFGTQKSHVAQTGEGECLPKMGKKSDKLSARFWQITRRRELAFG